MFSSTSHVVNLYYFYRIVLCTYLAIYTMIGREDKITEAVLFWNSRKVENLPASLSSRLKKVG